MVDWRQVMRMDKTRTGALIAAARKEKNMTQKELAAALHVSDRAVSKWERGAGFPDISLLEPLADTLGIGVLDLLRGEREAGAEPEITVRQALAVLARQAKERTRRRWRWSQAVATVLLLVPAGLILFGILATAGAFERKITAEVPAGVYSQTGRIVGETTVAIDGTRSSVWGGCYRGKFAIGCLDVTCQSDVTAIINWDAFGRGEGGERIGFTAPGYHVASGVESWLYMTEDMGDFGLRLEDGTIIATDKSYVPLLTADYYYAVRPPVEAAPWGVPME